MSGSADKCWLDKNSLINVEHKNYFIKGDSVLVTTIEEEVKYFFSARKLNEISEETDLVFDIIDDATLGIDGYEISLKDKITYIKAQNERGLLYGLFALVRAYQSNQDTRSIKSIPDNTVRMLNHWDNGDGSIERGYAGRSIFFEDNKFRKDKTRVLEYARLLASIGINAISINNVNVHKVESYFTREPFLSDVAEVASIFRKYGIKLFLSVNYAAPLETEELQTADPLDEGVKNWWKETANTIYSKIEDFGGFIVKADSENRPGPFTYGRNHADGANMLGEALLPHGGIVFWRCFVYDCKQDWRDRSIDRAKAAYEHFSILDGKFSENVILQIKNGPMDFQIREAVSPLFGALKNTNQVLEFQVTQEYTGQQKHIAYLVPHWKEILDFDTYSFGKGSTISKVIRKYPENNKYNGITAVSNVGLDYNWTGHKLAQANLYGYGRLIWDTSASSEEIASDWIDATFGLKGENKKTLEEILMTSIGTYEDYTSPLGIGWMVNIHHHYGPAVDGYEYDKWGTYHFSDRNGLGVDRTLATGTGFTRQFFDENFNKFENLETCPDELVLFFHHLPYTHVLKSGKIIIQHIYDTHFEGVEKVEKYHEQWLQLKPHIDEISYENVTERLNEQLRCAKEWRDQINTYYYRYSGIEDANGRVIYK